MMLYQLVTLLVLGICTVLFVLRSSISFFVMAPSGALREASLVQPVVARSTCRCSAEAARPPLVLEPQWPRSFGSESCMLYGPSAGCACSSRYA